MPNVPYPATREVHMPNHADTATWYEDVLAVTELAGHARWVTMKQIARETRLTIHEVDDALEKLIDKGLVMHNTTRPERQYASTPKGRFELQRIRLSRMRINYHNPSMRRPTHLRRS